MRHGTAALYTVGDDVSTGLGFIHVCQVEGPSCLLTRMHVVRMFDGVSLYGCSMGDRQVPGIVQHYIQALDR